MTERQMTADERRKETMTLARKTLEDKALQGVVGVNSLRMNPFAYGQLAVEGSDTAYDAAMESEGAQKERKKLMTQAREKGRALGVYGEPTISNYDVSTQIITQVQQSMAVMPLGDLGAIVEGLGKGFGLDFKVPEALKNYVPVEVDAKDKEARSEKENDALVAYQMLNQAYTRASALNSAKPAYFADVNSVGKALAEKYKPKEKK